MNDLNSQKQLRLRTEIIKNIEQAQRLIRETEKMLLESQRIQKEIDELKQPKSKQFLKKKLISLKRIHDQLIQRIQKEKDNHKKINLQNILKTINKDLALTTKQFMTGSRLL